MFKLLFSMSLLILCFSQKCESSEKLPENINLQALLNRNILNLDQTNGNNLGQLAFVLTVSGQVKDLRLCRTGFEGSFLIPSRYQIINTFCTTKVCARCFFATTTVSGQPKITIVLYASGPKGRASIQYGEPNPNTVATIDLQENLQMITYDYINTNVSTFQFLLSGVSQGDNIALYALAFIN